MKNIRDFDDYGEEGGYLIIDGTRENMPGGKVIVGSGGISIDQEVDEYETPILSVNTDEQTITKDGNELSIKLAHDSGIKLVDDEGYVEGIAVNVQPGASGGIDTYISEDSIYVEVKPGLGLTTELSVDRWHDTLDINTDYTLAINNNNQLGINTISAHDGDVLTYSNTDGVVWAAPAGGGGGGNPYTKVTVTPGAPYPNTEGREAWGFTFDDQDVNINNNTYSILSKDIGYDGNGWSSNETYAIDYFNIKLPANTDFPMAVVEFVVSTEYGAGVNKIKVFVGNTELPQLHDAPYSDNVLITDSHKTLDFDEIKDTINIDPAYKYLNGIHDKYISNSKAAYTNGNLVQVHIFGNGFKVIVSKPTDEPADS